MARIEGIVLYRLRLPLRVHYKVFQRVFRDFEPIVAELRDSDGHVGWGEAEITPGYANETPAGGWAWCRATAERLVGLEVSAARAVIAHEIGANPHAASVLMSALDMASAHPALVRQDS